jgi:hypothetical protein
MNEAETRAELIDPKLKACDIHHKLSVGRGGAFLDKDNMLAVSRAAHTAIHSEPSWARENGWLV